MEGDKVEKGTCNTNMSFCVAFKSISLILTPNPSLPPSLPPSFYRRRTSGASTTTFPSSWAFCECWPRRGCSSKSSRGREGGREGGREEGRGENETFTNSTTPTSTLHYRGMVEAAKKKAADARAASAAKAK